MRTNFREECSSIELAAQHLKSHNDFCVFVCVCVCAFEHTWLILNYNLKKEQESDVCFETEPGAGDLLCMNS